ncbi:MAG: hypothetical protein ONB23_06185 [candidate division KSB1 bacterium]|nr:hypothetical protein [candidate division KSB1 bacterium]
MHVQPVQRREYERYLLDSARQGLQDWRRVVDRWKASERTYVLWGYNPPQLPLRLAYLLSYLRREGLLDRSATEQAVTILRDYSGLRELVDRDLADRRAETRGRPLPLFVNIFLVPVLAGIIENFRHTGEVDPTFVSWLEEELALAVEPIFAHPEWGAMNRAILRSCGLWYAASVLPNHPEAPKWRKMAEVIAIDNLDHWEIEDASTYHPVWLFYMFWYLDLRGELAQIDSPFVRWYLEYFVRMIAPHGTIPDFGDGEWRSTWFLFVPCYEAAARQLGDPRWKWAAARIFRACSPVLTREHPHPAEIANSLLLAHQWCDDSCPAEPPKVLSCELLEDLVGKKIVFRNGWAPESTYLLLNYKEEHEGGWLDRQYLRDTISVEEEKMHHGHSDENAIVTLMSGGSVLLHDGGYRSGLPSGKYGAYRADYFHNRLVVRNEALDAAQDVYELLRNSGAYRPVRSYKIDFLTLERVDYSRTRLVDQRQGFLWDRALVFLREEEEFLVVDGFCPLREDFFTVSCLWHAQQMVLPREDLALASYQELSGEKLRDDRSLLIRFLAPARGRRRGTFEIERHYGTEICFHETCSAGFLAGRWLAFVTHLAPIAKGKDWQDRAGAAELLATSWGEEAVGIRLTGRNGTRHTLLVKLNLDRERLSGNVRPRYTYESGAVQVGDLETDAHFAHVWEEGASAGYSASVLTGLRWRGKTLLAVPRGTFGLQLDGAPDREAQAKWRAWEGKIPL